ncbi:unnamed protein product [Vitrella brassicaformis CCMP3155]|uniref:Uncharacterized protein n=2 Tax=Vitrella brassicaformis TaxID=1169539 RepID=A0A0G4ENW7_VITBC|nr:unnamed protein product [Vitrella brassicaformis CCMP3155]|eukprot:CEL99136.1 unnamed protein product [Vitrella brassicaformis CCMP3155]
MLRTYNTYRTFFRLKVAKNAQVKVVEITPPSADISLREDLESINELDEEEVADSDFAASRRPPTASGAHRITTFRIDYTPKYCGAFSYVAKMDVGDGTVEVTIKGNGMDRGAGKPQLRAGVKEIAKGDPPLDSEAER